MKPTMITVSSSQISEIGYDEPNQDLYVTFKNGTTYKYFNVPFGIYQLLLNATSVGKTLNEVVKGKYDSIKL